MKKQAEKDFLFLSTISWNQTQNASFNRFSKCWSVKLNCNTKLSILRKKLRSDFVIITSTARATNSQRWLTSPKTTNFGKIFSTFDAASRLKYSKPLNRA